MINYLGYLHMDEKLSNVKVHVSSLKRKHETNIL